jgi:cleavage and polyadenylation specificity factor subunit 3
MHPKKEARAALPAFELLHRSPDAVIVSHGHIDHCGALPYFCSMHSSALSYATTPTVPIMDRMLHNSVSVMQTIGTERGIEGLPLYTHEDVEKVIRRTYGIPYNQEFAVTYDGFFRGRFLQAGHVLGSASVLVQTEGHTVFYTGDICHADRELMAGLSPLNPNVTVDTLIIESTYGANPEADDVSYVDEVERFAQALRAVLLEGGTVLVPTFALGRTQEVLNIVARYQDLGVVPEVPVYASGLGRAIYEIYDRFVDHLRPDVELSPLSQFHRIGDVWNPEVVQRLLSQPSIIVATSGMMLENTPSAMIAQELVRHEHHAVFFTGYLDPDTLGYKLRTAQKGDVLVFRIGGEPVEVQLENIQWFHFSAHAPRSVLQNVIRQVSPRNVIFVHGDPDAIAWMRENCSDGCASFAPSIGETIELG